MSEARFRGTDRYVATDDLMMAVNAAVTLGRPFTGQGRGRHRQDPTGRGVAKRPEPAVYPMAYQSTIKAQQGYEYDAVSVARFAIGRSAVHEIGNYIVKGKLWEAFTAELQPVLLIDEIDKADIEFPNDLLLELDRMEFYVYETQQVIKARHRPIIIITSNNEKELPDAFLRRCFSITFASPTRKPWSGSCRCIIPT